MNLGKIKAEKKEQTPVEPVKLTPNKSVLTKPSAAPEEKSPQASVKAPQAQVEATKDKGGRKSGKEPGVAYERIGAEIKADNKKLLKIAVAMGDFLDPARALDYAIEQTFGKKYGKL